LYFFIMQIIFGLNPFPYHVCNVLIHVFNSLAVGYLVYLLTRNRMLAFASAVIFTSRVGHVIAIYWICVTTQSMPLLFFLLSLILYIHHRRSGSLGLLVGSYVFFALCVFSNINGPSLVVLITLYDVLIQKDRSPWSILGRESGFYMIVGVFLFLQFIVFGYHPPGDYRLSLGPLALQNFGILNVFACNSLYLITYLTNFSPPVMVAAGTLAGLATVSIAIAGFFKCARCKFSQGARIPLFFGLWYVWGFVPYLPLAEHLWPQYITTAAVGFSFLFGCVLDRFLRTRGLAAALCIMLVVSFFSIRLFEKEEYETKGIIYKSELARNVISDLRHNLKYEPHAERIIILNGKQELWWILQYGTTAGVFLDRYRPIFYLTSPDTIISDPASLVLRYENMRLYIVR
ncbi:MAG: hypothetical protein JSV16_11510, partial [Candidatus Hydrogenedentota bacterium]